MSKILELREKRTKLWNDAKAFLDSHQKDGILSPEDRRPLTASLPHR